MNNRTETAWKAFREAVARQGGTVLETEWLGANTPHAVLCGAGHRCSPRPNHTKSGVGICRTCAGKDPVSAWKAFREAVARQGGTVLETEWLGSHGKHRSICGAGHRCTPTPSNVSQGNGMCVTCAGQNPVSAWKAFREAVARQGGTVLETEWLGANTPHAVLCGAGHLCSPDPSNVVHRLQGICRWCAGKTWDAFYVVTGTDDVVKFGITSGDPSRRLNEHRADGFSNLVLVRTGLSDGLALDAETQVKRRLRAAGYEPVRGREYFAPEASRLIEAWTVELLD